MANKTMRTTRFEVEMFNGKRKNFLSQKRVKTLLAKEGLLKVLHDKESKLHDITDAD